MSTITLPPKEDSNIKVQEPRRDNPNISWNGGKGLGDEKKCPNPKDSDCICSVCIQDKQYLIWALEV